MHACALRWLSQDILPASSPHSCERLPFQRVRTCCCTASGQSGLARQTRTGSILAFSPFNKSKEASVTRHVKASAECQRRRLIVVPRRRDAWEARWPHDIAQRSPCSLLFDLCEIAPFKVVFLSGGLVDHFKPCRARQALHQRKGRYALDERL